MEEIIVPIIIHKHRGVLCVMNNSLWGIREKGAVDKPRFLKFAQKCAYCWWLNKHYEHLSDYRAPEFTSNTSEFHVTLWNLNFEDEVIGEIASIGSPLIGYNM